MSRALTLAIEDGVWGLLSYGSAPRATARLALSIGRAPSDLFMLVLSARIDETGTDGRSPYVILGGYVASSFRWQGFDKAWDKRLRKEGLSYFHASEFWGSKGEARGISRTRKTEIVRRLWSVQDGRLLFGFSVRLDNDVYDYYLKNLPRKMHRESQYGFCFRTLASATAVAALKYTKASDLSLNFLLESGHDNGGDAERVFAELKTDDVLGGNFGVIAFGAKKEYPGLQAADGILAAAMRSERKARVPVDVQPEASLADLRTDKIKTPVFREQITTEQVDRYLAQRVANKEREHAEWLARRAAKSSSVSADEEGHQ